jgi:DNA-binding NarL/FixJ family response regulator
LHVRLPGYTFRATAGRAILDGMRDDPAEVAMTRVLMGDFSALHRLGFEDILRVEGIELVETTSADVVGRLLEALPDVIVLDLDQDETAALVRRIVHDFPTVKVVACSSAEPLMRIFPPLHYGEFYTTDLDPALLTSAIQA